MSRFIPAADRIVKARALIAKARKVPLPEDLGRHNLSYIAAVKDLMQQARDLVKFISYTPSASAEMKEEVKRIFEEAAAAEKEILHPDQTSTEI
jgi:hypothetical protein